MNLEDDLSKFERQVNNFSIAGAAGNFHIGFTIGDDARGSGAGVQRARVGPTPEDRISFLEQSFKNLTIRGGHDVSVTGSLAAGGFAISAKAAPSGEGATGPTPTGACCIGASCSILTSADCATMGGTYLGDGALCSPNPCAEGACCLVDEFFNPFCASRPNEAACTADSGVWQGDGTSCDPNPCVGICCEVFTDGFISCDFRSQAECEAFASDPDVASTAFYTGETVCFRSPLCEGGGCCFSDGSCARYLDEASCLAAGGVSFAGVGVLCTEEGGCP